MGSTERQLIEEGGYKDMKKTFILPSLEVKEFDRTNIVTESGTPAETNMSKAEEVLVGVDYVKVTL